MSEEIPQYRDNETGELIKEENAETLAELEMEGHLPEGVTRVQKEGDKEQDKKPADENPNKDKEDSKEEDKEGEDKEEKEEEGDDKEDESDEGEKTPRKEKFVFIGTHKKVLKEVDRLAEENDKLRRQIESGIKDNINKDGVIDNKAIEEEMAKIAEESGLDPETIKKLGNTLAKSISLTFEEKLKKVDELKAKQVEELEEASFQKDFRKTLSAFTPEQQEHIKKHAETIKNQAYTEEYMGAPLRTLMIEYLHDNPPPARKAGAEDTRSKGGVSKESKNFEDITEDDLKSMSDEESDKYFDWVEKNKHSL